MMVSEINKEKNDLAEREKLSMRCKMFIFVAWMYAGFALMTFNNSIYI